MVGSSTEVATAVWVGNIIGDTSMRNISGGTVMRHDIFRPIMQLANEQYGGDAFPAAPTRLLNGSGVQLPDITGMYVDEAMLLLNGIGLNLEIRLGAGGVVSYFEPAPGTLLARGQTVYVNTDGDAGDRYVPSASMPNIISPALTEVEARGALSAAGMYGAINFYCVEGSAGTETGNGVAIGQSPEPGEVVKVDVGVEVAMQCAAGAAEDPNTALE